MLCFITNYVCLFPVPIYSPDFTIHIAHFILRWWVGFKATPKKFTLLWHHIAEISGHLDEWLFCYKVLISRLKKKNTLSDVGAGVGRICVFS